MSTPVETVLPGHTTHTVQPRCFNMSKHIGEALPMPCDHCYSVVVTSTVIPFREPTDWPTMFGTKHGPVPRS